MLRTTFTVRTPDGRCLDHGVFINCPDLVDKRIAAVLTDHPDAVVDRKDEEK